MKTTPKQILALLLVLVLLLSLCACVQKTQTEPNESRTSTDKVKMPTKPDKKTPEKQPEEAPLQNDMRDRTSRDEASDTQPVQYGFSQEAETSLGWLRDRIDFPMTMFGAAYLGYVGGLFDEGFEAGFPAWLWETNEAMLLEYPFIAEIDEEHIIGGAGHLYCIVPVDENATVAINRVQWNEKTQTDEVTEVLYRSESGEPVLLFANLDGVAYEADTQVFITDNNGNTCEWYPSLDAMSYLAPCISEAGDYLSFDFTEYAWYNAPAEFSAWLADGWSGMTALGLAGSQRDGMGWITETMVGETSRYAYFSLRFYLEDETGGTVDLEWVYEDSDEFEEMWSGFWTIQTIQDGPSYVTLSLSLVGGNNYGVTDGPMYLCETYPLLISPSGTELLVGAGERHLPAVHVAEHNGMCADTGRRIEGVQGANCFEVCIHKFCLVAIYRSGLCP